MKNRVPHTPNLVTSEVCVYVMDMKHALLVVALIMLSGCAQTSVSQLGPDRYRVTSDNYTSLATAESEALQQAQSHCATQGKIADARLTMSRPYSMMSYAFASAEFTCVKR
jgi:hypothetical protein